MVIRHNLLSFAVAKRPIWKKRSGLGFGDLSWVVMQWQTQLLHIHNQGL